MLKKDLPSQEKLMNTIYKTINTAWNIGNKMHQISIDKWLENFTGEALVSEFGDQDIAANYEKDLALFLLCNFVYYNENEVKHLTKIMLEKYLHEIVCSNDIAEVDDDYINKLIRKTQFAQLGAASESSAFLLYLFRQVNELSKYDFIEKSDTENIVFIDDFSITGTQAHDYINDYIKKRGNDKKVYVILMLTTEEALTELKKINGITVLSCILMDDRSKVFSKDSLFFEGYKDEYKIQAKRMCEYYGKKIVRAGENPLGFGGEGYMFGSFYNTPDNTLPIFWSELNGWFCLFKRYDKKYRGGIKFGGKYV